MKILCFFFCIGFGFFSSAQEKKKDSVDIDKLLYEFKPRIFYPYDCSCPDRVIYKEVKKGDKEFNPYNYKEIRPIRIESLPKEMQDEILEQIYKKQKKDINIRSF
ncbi:MAG: hypothetical protein E2590_04835 [Chryseobacterium sp.]|nr:hypothetical protein [Chryseobacterium sp.]